MLKGKLNGQSISGDATHTLLGTTGGLPAVTTLLDGVLVIGAGTASSMYGGRCTFQGIANGSSGAFSAVITVEVSNDNANWELLGTMTLAGTATTADSTGLSSDAPWAFVRGNVTSISGTGATATLLMAV
jgi:hypothetical protein